MRHLGSRRRQLVNGASRGRARTSSSLATLATLAAFAASSPAYAAPGDLDPSFGSAGIVTTSFGGHELANGAALQADGKIVAAGPTRPTGSTAGDAFALARYNGDGTLDRRFGKKGKVTTSVSGAAATDVAIQSDGKIVAVGGDAFDRCALVLYNRDGSVDRVRADICDDFTQRVAIQSDGKIVIAGYGGSPARFVLKRYHPDGTPDTTFGSSGRVETRFPNSSGDAAFDLAIQTDGKIVAAGGTNNLVTGARFALARYNQNGTLDQSCGAGGLVVGPPGTAHAVAIQPLDQAIVIAGPFSLARYLRDLCAADLGFGNNGSASTGGLRVRDIAIQPLDQKIVATGGLGGTSVTRYEPDGTVDAGFGSGGSATTAAVVDPSAIELQPADGKIVVAGATQESETAGGSLSYDFALARFLAK